MRNSPLQWFEDDSFWVELHPFLFPQERLDRAALEVESLLALVGEPIGTALDLCCGPGRHAIELARRGVRVTGVDRTAAYLRMAEDTARLQGVDVQWLQADARKYVAPDRYDLVLSMFTSFGYFAEASDDARLLANVLASLRPGGTFVVDLVGKELLARNFRPASSQRAPDGTLLVELHTILDGWRRIHNEWMLIRDEHVRTFSFDLRLYSGAELAGALCAAGFEAVRIHGDLEGSEYGPAAKRLVALARRPA